MGNQEIKKSKEKILRHDKDFLPLLIKIFNYKLFIGRWLFTGPMIVACHVYKSFVSSTGPAL
jgi:hypothetical protein